MAVLRLSAARRGGRCRVGAPTVAVGAARRLRCDARIARAAAVPLVVALNAPRLHGSSPVRPLWAGLPLALLALQAAPGLAARPLARRGQSAGLPSSRLAFSPPHKSPPPGTARRAAALVVLVDTCHGGAGKAAAGCAPAATYAAPRSAGLRGLRVALRRRVGHTLFELRAQRRCASSVAPARGRVCVAALAARAPQGSRSEAEAAAFERRRTPGRGFATHALRKSLDSHAPRPTPSSRNQ